MTLRFVATRKPAILRELRVGDICLYEGTGLFSKIVQFNTGSRYSHVEVYDGAGYSLASRDGLGVDRYPFRDRDLSRVLRPHQPYKARNARAWFKTVRGQTYDWMGLLVSRIAKWQGRENQKQFCSEFAARLLKRGGVECFNGADADGITPGDFAKSVALYAVWDVDDEMAA